ncbi:MAG: hypothetical protein LQ338_002045 [Usnochroma carphineum]|nr:MAG: hypothetical protein LQ338_002045 [Usnochroma carphineum]
MHLTLLPLLLLLFPLTHAATVTIHNTQPWPSCLKVETSSGTFTTTTICNGFPGIAVPPSARTAFHPSLTWTGALTPILNGITGTRFELNFAASSTGWIPAGGTMYDADMELGISPATLGPSDHRLLPDGSPSLAGEQDPLEKATEAWLRSPNRWELLKYPKYVVAADQGKRLAWVYNDKDAPGIVRAFFQLEAGFQAYMGAGSVAGNEAPERGSVEAQLMKAQDRMSWWVGTREMTVTIY